jgi:hypothetical protein
MEPCATTLPAGRSAACEVPARANIAAAQPTAAIKHVLFMTILLRFERGPTRHTDLAQSSVLIAKFVSLCSDLGTSFTI